MTKERNFLNQFDFNKKKILYVNLDDNEDSGESNLVSKSNENTNKDERTKRLERLDKFYNDDESSANENQSSNRTSIVQIKYKEIDGYLNLKNVNYLNLREFLIKNQYPNLFVLFKKIGCAQVANILTKRTFSHANSKTNFKNTNLKEENLKLVDQLQSTRLQSLLCTQIFYLFFKLFSFTLLSLC